MNSDKAIIINGRFLCNNSMDGIGRFSLEICKELKKSNLNFKILIPEWLEYNNLEDFQLIKFGNLKSHFWEQIDLFRFLKSNGSPLLINLSGLGPLWYKNQIITIHDLSFYANKSWFSKTYTFFYSYATPIVAKNACKILTVSKFSKGEIINYLKVKNEKIEVVYNAVSNAVSSKHENFQISPIVNSVVKEKYILAVSSIDPRKNLQRLINSFLQLESEDYKLVLVGKASNHFNVQLDTNHKNVIYTGFVSDIDLSVLYENCAFFVYPSLYEGFGIPPLEAMKKNCAVIVSDIPSLKEVCESAALYVNPFDIESIKKGMMSFICNNDLKEEFKKKGNIRSEFFSWESSCKKVCDIINKVNV